MTEPKQPEKDRARQRGRPRWRSRCQENHVALGQQIHSSSRSSRLNGRQGRRRGGVTLETVGLNAGIAMAALAKLARGVDRDITTIGTLFGVTPYALLETVLSGADTFAHGQITLMANHIHVIAPHELGIPHAMVTPTFGVRGDWDLAGTGQGGGTQQHPHHHQYYYPQTGIRHACS
ncbi:hypothetical protein CCP3SC15_560012 [Gammaproteobacteria bacterium]